MAESFDIAVERAKERLMKKPLVICWRGYLKKVFDGSPHFRIPESGMTPLQKSKYLPWTVKELRAVEPQLTISTTLPIECKGEDCVFADSCPLVKHDVVSRALGNPCPIECVDAFRYFSGYVTDLGVKPTDFTDLQMINDLVRLQIMINRCDKFLQKEDPFEVTVAGVDARTSLSHNARAPHALVHQQKMLRQDMDKIYQRLLASRDAKLNTTAKPQGMLQNLGAIIEAARKKRQEESDQLPRFEEELVGDELLL